MLCVTQIDSDHLLELTCCAIAACSLDEFQKSVIRTSNPPKNKPVTTVITEFSNRKHVGV